MREEKRYESKYIGTFYIANDGTEFDTQEDCIEYELSLKKKEPINAWLDDNKVGLWYRIDNNDQIEKVQNKLGWNTKCWQDNRIMFGEWGIGEWYASNRSEHESWDYGYKDTLVVYSLTEFEKQFNDAVQKLRNM